MLLQNVRWELSRPLDDLDEVRSIDANASKEQILAADILQNDHCSIVVLCRGPQENCHPIVEDIFGRTGKDVVEALDRGMRRPIHGHAALVEKYIEAWFSDVKRADLRQKYTAGVLTPRDLISIRCFTGIALVTEGGNNDCYHYAYDT